MPHEYSADFGLFRLHQTLVDLKLDGPTQSRAVEYFWTNCDRWASHSVSQIDFDATARTSLAAHVGKRLRPAPRPKAPESQPWEKCRHYGGTRLCPRCKSPVQPGAMARAERMWTNHRDFVRSRIHAELLPYFHGRPYVHFDDLEATVWQSVGSRIDQFTTNTRLAEDGSLAWLKTVVHGTVVDHFRHQFREKRDVRKDAALNEAKAADWNNDHNALFAFAEPTRPGGEAPDRDDDLKATALQVGLRKKSQPSKIKL